MATYIALELDEVCFCAGLSDLSGDDDVAYDLGD